MDVDDERRRSVGFLNGTASVTVHAGANGGVIAPCLRSGRLRHRRHAVVPVLRVTVVRERLRVDRAEAADEHVDGVLSQRLVHREVDHRRDS